MRMFNPHERRRPAAGAAPSGKVVGVCVGAAILISLPLAGLQATAARSGDLAPALAGAACPQTARPLPPDAIAGATRAALREAPALYGGPRGIDVRDRRATRAAVASFAGVRGRQVRRECGRRVQRRTVVVDVEFPRMLPSASLSQGTVFVSRIGQRYRVWEVAH